MAGNQIPNFNKKYFCIVDRKNPLLASIISSYVNISSEYLPMFEFSEVPIDRNETNEDLLKVNVITRNRAEEFSIRIHNALSALGGCEYLILGGLDANQKSYLTFLHNYNVIDIEDVNNVDINLKYLIDKKENCYCNENDFYKGLYVALRNNFLLKIDNTIKDICIESENKEGLLVIEKNNVTSTIIAINYAIAFDLDVAFIDTPETDRKEINYLIEQWQEQKNQHFFYDLSALLYGRVENINFGKYKFATFFTFGAPYSLVLNNVISFTYINNLLYPDFFIFNNIYKENSWSLYSSIVFSPLAFGEDEETNFVIQNLKQNNYFVKELIGKEASVYNIDYHVREFPYDILHFCSHGGEVDGFSLIEEFTDREGNTHVVEYDEVVSFAPDKSEELIPVTSKFIWRKFDGLVWKSKELKEKKYSHYVFVDMIDQLFKKKCESRKRKLIIKDSCAIKCFDFNYQAMFNMISGLHSNPFIFNNTCWSWSDISDSFLSVGARCYIGTLWAINNDIAKICAETFYDNLFEGTILNALQKALFHTKGNENENIYLLWGVHFSTLKKGNSISESRMNIAKRLLHSFYRWREHINTVQDAKVQEQIKSLIKWNSDQLFKYFYIESLELIKPKK